MYSIHDNIQLSIGSIPKYRVTGVTYCIMSFAEWIDLELNKRNWNRADLARKSGMSESSISHIYTGRRNPGSELCAAIAHAFDLPPEVVFRAAGLLPPVSDSEEIIRMTLHEMGFMTDEDRLEMLEYARLRRRMAEERANLV